MRHIDHKVTMTAYRVNIKPRTFEITEISFGNFLGLPTTIQNRNEDWAYLHGPTDPRSWCHFILQPGFLNKKIARGLIVSTVVK